jgi:hypothetical protein
MEKRYRINSTPLFHVPGLFRWIRQAVAPHNRKHATELLEALGLKPTDAKFLANPKNKVKATPDGDDLLLEFTTPSRARAKA